MGTNFYFVTDRPIPDAHTSEWEFDGDRVWLRYHIGKRSGGWEFAFRIYPPTIESFSDWRKIIAESAARPEVQDEYGKRYSLTEFWQLVEDTRRDGNEDYVDYGIVDFAHDPEGWSVTTDEFA